MGLCGAVLERSWSLRPHGTLVLSWNARAVLERSCCPGTLVLSWYGALRGCPGTLVLSWNARGALRGCPGTSV
eukprot:6587688-Pyramimonas_sp.AAC.1